MTNQNPLNFSVLNLAAHLPPNSGESSYLQSPKAWAKQWMLFPLLLKKYFLSKAAGQMLEDITGKIKN